MFGVTAELTLDVGWMAYDNADHLLAADYMGHALRLSHAADDRLGLTRAAIDGLVAEPVTFTGAAAAQVAAVVGQVAAVVDRYPAAAAYQPVPIL